MGHSLGGASLLIYVVMRRRARRAHRLYRLILLTPAGFLATYPLVRWPRALRLGLSCPAHAQHCALSAPCTRPGLTLARLPSLVGSSCLACCVRMECLQELRSSLAVDRGSTESLRGPGGWR